MVSMTQLTQRQLAPYRRFWLMYQTLKELYKDMPYFEATVKCDIDCEPQDYNTIMDYIIEKLGRDRVCRNFIEVEKRINIQVISNR